MPLCALIIYFKSTYKRKDTQNIPDKWLQARGFPSSQHFAVRAKLHLAPLCSAVLSADDRLHKHISLPEKVPSFRSKERAFLCRKGAAICCDCPTHLVKRIFHVPVRPSPSAEISSQAFRFNFGNPPRQVSQAPISTESKRRWNEQNVTQSSYDKYVARPVSDEVAFVLLFLMIKHKVGMGNKLCHIPDAAMYFCSDIAHADIADTWLVSTLCFVLGNELSHRLGVVRGDFLLPFCYVTLYSKFWQGPVRLWQKLHHSCVKKIMPPRSSWSSDSSLRFFLKLLLQLRVSIHEAQQLQQRACELGMKTTITLQNAKRRIAWFRFSPSKIIAIADMLKGLTAAVLTSMMHFWQAVGRKCLQAAFPFP